MNPTLQVLLGGGGLGGLATSISNAVNGNGTPGGTSATASGALAGGPGAPTPANPGPSSLLRNPLVLVLVAGAGLLALIAALRR